MNQETLVHSHDTVNGTRATARLVCVLLCGGESRRMGEDKAAIELAGRTLLDRALDALRDLDAPIVLATGPSDRYPESGLPSVQDAPRTAGPAAGLLAAMEAWPAERYVLTACDMPRLDAGLLRRLVERAEADDLDACFFTTERGHEPLCAVYSRRILGLLRSAQAHEKRRVTAFLDERGADALRVGTLGVDDLPRGLRERDCARNVNTPEELRDERRAWEGGGA
ncbi:MAG: molybdenum cofactor guanylyltransferase [Planctomycetes bacterium]|nr:molybdenum cofactor guanylyltransferase [Planctomycetota bacterium]MCB9905236.1 molybdenum cofactor guanylyltransferase [Planctomycetota bacterium]